MRPVCPFRRCADTSPTPWAISRASKASTWCPRQPNCGHRIACDASTPGPTAANLKRGRFMTDLVNGKAQGGFDPSSTDLTPYSAAMTPEEKQYPLDPTVLDAEVYRDPGRFRSEMDRIL